VEARGKEADQERGPRAEARENEADQERGPRAEAKAKAEEAEAEVKKDGARGKTAEAK
jgi:hypothetical protein